MLIEALNEQNKTILVSVPLTTISGKTRIKQRDNVFGYGIPFASRSKVFNQKNYVEWQIGYDAVIPNNVDNFREKDYKNYIATTLKESAFTGSNGKNKTLYELSEYLYYFYKWGVFTKDQLTELKSYLNNLSVDNLLDKHQYCQIKRTQANIKTINNIDFYALTVEYPQLIYRFDEYEIIAEITIGEKQRAIGTQPMLYFCFPITELQSDGVLIGRTAEIKECASFVFNENNAFIVLEMIKIFGMLSESHKSDTIAILEAIINA
ncbi:hypothetical protein SPONN_2007 [uncultured Candidatus Thioglobus sp.]|nr:hypothetical protein SPONN_2007 [uncultured Candidatus Thioglobus sp.]